MTILTCQIRCQENITAAFVYVVILKRLLGADSAARGHAVPNRLLPAAGLQCPACMSAMKEVPLCAKVFATTYMRDVVIIEGVCPECGETAHCDGAEHLVLRKGRYSSAALGTTELCFTWEFMNRSIEQFTSKGVHFWTMWKQQMKEYNVKDVPNHVIAGLHQLYRHFIAAIMDFVDLQQLPYSRVLRCKCAEPHQHLVSDGILVSCRRRFMHLQTAWGPELPADGEEVVPALFGSEYAQRFAVPDSRLRKELRAMTTQKGFTAEEVTAVRQTCQDLLQGGRPADVPVLPAAEALLILTDHVHNACILQHQPDDDNTHFKECVRGLVRELSSSSPACQVVPPADLAAVQSWQVALHDALAADSPAAAVAACSVFMTEHRSSLEDSAPLLEPCLTHVLHLAAQQQPGNDIVCSAVFKLVDSLVGVRCRSRTWLASPGCLIAWHGDRLRQPDECAGVCRLQSRALSPSASPRCCRNFSLQTSMRSARVRRPQRAWTRLRRHTSALVFGHRRPLHILSTKPVRPSRVSCTRSLLKTLPRMLRMRPAAQSTSTPRACLGLVCWCASIVRCLCCNVIHQTVHRF